MTNNQSSGFQDKVAFVTGAGSGIGKATAVAFVEAGASVVLTDTDDRAINELAADITANGGNALAIPCDIQSTDAIQAAIAKTVDAFGRLDFAFNNAGVDQTGVPTAECTVEEWDRIMGTDLRGVFLCTKFEIQQMLKQGGGAIVNCSSGAGVRGFKNQPAYVAAKHGVVGLSRAAALDYVEQNIRVNVVCPGVTDTPMMRSITGDTAAGREPMIEQEPIGRMGLPEEIAAAVIWLCSDAASFVVGHAMLVDGGQTV
jgi:NAD(P)-dependent dehydrogenase (short-subunit alcohol dehydrogenase family)